MNVHLMYRDQDFALETPIRADRDALASDVDLSTLVEAMSKGDAWLGNVAEKALKQFVADGDTIRYRQAILSDCISNPETIRAVYDLAVETMEAERKSFWFGTLARRPGSVLYRADELLHMLVASLRRLRRIADEGAPRFRSDGFSMLFTMLQRELSDDYFELVERHLRALKFEHGVLVSVQLGDGNRGTGYVLREAPQNQQSGWLSRIFQTSAAGTYSFQLSPRDESGMRALSELRDVAINDVANTAAQSADHVLAFFAALRAEIAFYVGCLNLRARLQDLGMPTCLPEIVAVEERKHTAHDLYDASLALSAGRSVVTNDLDGDDRSVFIITGANQGGKSSFLRAIGIAQVLMQCGMFVPARAFTANICADIFSHYRREEDPSMLSGKLDEEMERMSEIVDRAVPNALVLFNESFAATNEREGSEIARQVVEALAECGLKLFFVTHLYEFAAQLRRDQDPSVLCLRAERLENGTRTFKIVVGEPLETSYGRDLYERVFTGEEIA